jgi:hypothetical protein
VGQLAGLQAFRDGIYPARLEVAMGLETVHPEALAMLNKQMTVELFLQAAQILAREKVALRVFLLVRPPSLTEMEGVEWAKRSLDVALCQARAEVVCVIPTRAGNGAMEALQATGQWQPPTLASLEEATDYGVALCQHRQHHQHHRGENQRVFADLWDVEKFYDCPHCGPLRKARLERINETGQTVPPVLCPWCNG